MMDVERVPAVRIDMRIRHVLAVNDALDRLGLDGETEVKFDGIIADAVCPGPIYVEVDRGWGDLRVKARRYGTRGPLVIVTPRPEVAGKAFERHPDVVIVPEDALEQDEVMEDLRKALAV